MTRRRTAIALASLALAAGSSAATAAPCPENRRMGADAVHLQQDGVTVSYRTWPADIRVGQPFTIEIVTCLREKDRAPDRIRVDATMPAHGHGMNYRPTERQIAPGHSKFDNMVLHMPGMWELSFDVYDGEARTRVVEEIRLDR